MLFGNDGLFQINILVRFEVAKNAKKVENIKSFKNKKLQASISYLDILAD
jgi:hypothetical protein